MTCPSYKIDSNITGLSFAEEQCLKELPISNVFWYNLEPNSYSDFGGELTTIARSPIDPSRQNKKGVIADLEASGGFNIDFTQNNTTRLLQGFFFADARELPTTMPLNNPAVLITSVGLNSMEVPAFGNAFQQGFLVMLSGFENATNSGLKTIATGSTATTIEFDETLEPQASPPETARIDTVGFQFILGDAYFTVEAGLPVLNSSVADLSTLPKIIPGMWLFIGGDDADTRFNNNVGYARVKTVSANKIVFDDVTFVPTNELGTGKSIQVFSGMIIKNENQYDLIKRRSYQIERTLGIGAYGQPQAEYLIGAVASEMTLNVPQAEKLNADMMFMACDNTHRSGKIGDEVKSGEHVPALAEDAFNTSSDIYRIALTITESETANPLPLFAYASEVTLGINNGINPVKAIGVLGAIDTSTSNFVVSGSLTAYFTDVEALKAVRDNADVGFSMIFAAKNAGFLFDVPLLSLGGGRVNVEKDAPVTVPLEINGAENKNGYTLLYQKFSYLPDIAMPV